MNRPLFYLEGMNNKKRDSRTKYINSKDIDINSGTTK